MIGVVVQSADRKVAREFFELFKTPWEFYQPGRRYEVMVCTEEQCPSDAAGLVLLYRAEPSAFDAQHRIAISSSQCGGSACWEGRPIPLFGKAANFALNRFSSLMDETGRRPRAMLTIRGQTTTVRIGYDLFAEVGYLLGQGQPPANAQVATLDLHIALLRDLITRSGLALVEIPPVPDGYNFIACLTHDIDHPILRNHCLDHTMFGFLGRATIGSLLDVCRGRRRLGTLSRNWAAVSRLPFVYLGAAQDLWSDFDRYLELEAGLGSTYFVIPKKEYPGRGVNGSRYARRASRYAVSEIRPQLTKIISAGAEVGLHGIDAWLDSASGCEESGELHEALGVTRSGVRMHWLAFNERSPVALDQAGFCYDSSFGYNETVGFRAGTAQVYKPIEATRMLELPLHIMDTALFLPKYLDLREAEAARLVRNLIEEVARFGGALTINWHDRSIAPERLWEGFYLKLLEELRQRGAWFPTASQAVAWFQKRRSANFDAVEMKDGVLKVRVSAAPDPRLPGLRVRVHRAGANRLNETKRLHASTGFEDRSLHQLLESTVALSV
jgi:hypothetical protein